MRKVFKYGTLGYLGAKPGDSVRFVDAPSPGKTGTILRPRETHEINATLIKVDGSRGYVEVKPQSSTATAVGEAASAGGVRINLPVSAGGSLKIS